MNFKKILAWFLFPLLFMKSVSAHCPLCTVGAVAAAGGAAWLGVNTVIIGIFIGAFAVSMGWWVSRLLKRKYIPYQRSALIAFSFITTIIPLLPLLGENYPIYISLLGQYGSLLNRTYLIDLFFVGSVLGGFVICLAPWLSKKLTDFRNGKMIPYQGITLTFVLLMFLSITVEIII